MGPHQAEPRALCWRVGPAEHRVTPCGSLQSAPVAAGPCRTHQTHPVAHSIRVATEALGVGPVLEGDAGSGATPPHPRLWATELAPERTGLISRWGRLRGPEWVPPQKLPWAKVLASLELCPCGTLLGLEPGPPAQRPQWASGPGRPPPLRRARRSLRWAATTQCALPRLAPE